MAACLFPAGRTGVTNVDAKDSCSDHNAYVNMKYSISWHLWRIHAYRETCCFLMYDDAGASNPASDTSTAARLLSC